MCFSFNNADNRAAFLRDEDAYCRKFGLTGEQRAAVKSRSVLRMIEAGGNIYYLPKLAGIFDLNVQDIGAQQTDMTVENFKANWMAMRGALTGRVIEVHRNYHVPISNTAAATVVLENRALAQREAA
jgi:protocatechuate 4,5-dioxygenase alpha chain